MTRIIDKNDFINYLNWKKGKEIRIIKTLEY